MSTEDRQPLREISINARPGPSTTIKPIKLAPIFLRTPTSFHSSPPSSSTYFHSSPDLSILRTPTTSELHFDPSRIYRSHPSPSHKRVKLDSSSSGSDSEDELMDIDIESDRPRIQRVRTPSISDFFSPTTPSRTDPRGHEKTRRVLVKKVVPIEEDVQEKVWRRPRARLGLSGSVHSACRTQVQPRATLPPMPYLQTLFTQVTNEGPELPPTKIFLSSAPRPSFPDREFSPALAVAFNHTAKNYGAAEAKEAGRRRLLAVAGEEGGVRIVDVDEGLGWHRDARGHWWRAHSNAIFDIKWSGDDTRILTASGDQTNRIHALTSPTPVLLASLKGHTSSVKTAVFFDPSRSYTPDPSSTSSVIASGSRDGNILVYDLRCQGQRFRETLDLATSRVDGPGLGSIPSSTSQTTDCEINPVMIIKHAHGDKAPSWSRSASRSVTSLVAMETMPGVLASGGSFDGIVKLWDLRFPTPTNRSPNPRPTCTPIASLSDPTILCDGKSRRPRAIISLCEQKTTGDLFALCGDSKIHTLRPSAALSRSEYNPDETVLPKSYLGGFSSFFVKMAISPDGKYLSSGCSEDALLTWEIEGKGNDKNEVEATRLALDHPGSARRHKQREIGCVDWGKDVLAACADDCVTRIWRSKPEVARMKRETPAKAWDWLGAQEADMSASDYEYN